MFARTPDFFAESCGFQAQNQSELSPSDHSKADASHTGLPNNRKTHKLKKLLRWFSLVFPKTHTWKAIVKTHTFAEKAGEILSNFLRHCPFTSSAEC